MVVNYPAMHYYYVRFNIYPAGSPPEEKEIWLTLDDHHDDKQMKILLETAHKHHVSIIESDSITKEEYDKGNTK